MRDHPERIMQAESLAKPLCYVQAGLTNTG